MNIVEVTKGERITSVEVQLTRSIRVGHDYQISPTMGMLGVEDGVVRVEGIYTFEDLEALPQYKSLGDPEVLVEDDPVLRSEYWVLYSYRNQPKDVKYQYAFPYRYFIDHTSAWY